jgi:hypothetical protein
MKQSDTIPPLHTMEGLRAEQRRLQLVIKEQEAILRSRVKQLPGELFYAGAGAIVPAVLTGKISGAVLGAGRSLINKVVQGKSKQNDSKLVAMAKQAGLFTLAKIAFNAFVRKKF